MKEINKTELIIRIYNYLHIRPLTINSLSNWLKQDKIECSPRTLYRYMDALVGYVSVLGEEIEVLSGQNNQKTWRLIFKRFSRERLNKYDINSMYLFYNFIPKSIQLPRKDSMDKIERVLHEQFSKSIVNTTINSSFQSFYNTNFHESNYTEEEHENLDLLIEAIDKRNCILINKTQFDNTGLSFSIDFSKPFCPVKIVFHRGTLHVCLFCDNDELILLAIEQIVELKILNSKFSRTNIEPFLEKRLKENFGVTHNIDDELYDIVIEFAKETGDFVSRHTWHPTQNFKVLKSGNYLMTMHCGINRELIGWIMMWMSNARVKGPKTLQNMVADKMRHALSYYEEDKPLIFNNTFRKSSN